MKLISMVPKCLSVKSIQTSKIDFIEKQGVYFYYLPVFQLLLSLEIYLANYLPAEK